MTEDLLIDKTKFKDVMGKYITQSLFLEIGYDADKAVYTLKDADYEYKGVVYPSLRRLYLEMADPEEYFFATTYLWGWEHWQRIVDNKVIREHIDQWRDELTVKLRALGVRNVISQSKGNLSAAKWVADGKWKEKPKGRPTKTSQAQERAQREAAAQEAEADLRRVIPFRKET
jgi:hypothetical protein